MKTLDLAYKIVLSGIKDIKSRGEKVTNNSLVKETGFTKSRISNLIKDLKKSGLVNIDREILNEKENNISLTSKGEVNLLLFKIETTSVLSPDELDIAVWKGLKKIYETLKRK